MTLWGWLHGDGPARALAGTRVGPVELTPLRGGRVRMRVSCGESVHQADLLVSDTDAGALEADADLHARVRAWAAREVGDVGGLQPAHAPGSASPVWSELPSRLLDALVPPISDVSLAAWLEAWRPQPVSVSAGGVGATWRPVGVRVSRRWADVGAAMLHAEVIWDAGGDSPVVAAGPMRIGSVGPHGWRCPPPPGAEALAQRWCAVVRDRLADVAVRAGGEAMVPPWLVAPNAPLATILAEGALRGPPPPALSLPSASVERATRHVARLSDVHDLPRWALGGFVVEVDPGGGRVAIVAEGVRAVILDTHPWEPGLRGGIDEDAAGTVALVRWLGQVIASSGTDARVRWVARDAEGPGGLEDGDHEGSVAAFLTLEDPLEPVMDSRVQGLPVGTTPWHAWSEPVDPDVLARARAVRDRFREEWVFA
jgi:hypothetical protein